MTIEQVRRYCCRWAQRHNWDSWSFKEDQFGRDQIHLENSEERVPGLVIEVSAKLTEEELERHLLSYVGSVREARRKREALCLS